MPTIVYELYVLRMADGFSKRRPPFRHPRIFHNNLYMRRGPTENTENAQSYLLYTHAIRSSNTIFNSFMLAEQQQMEQIACLKQRA